MGIHWSTVSLYRRAAAANGLLDPVGEYIPHRRAGLYRFSEKAETLTKPLGRTGTQAQTLIKNLTSGLVRIPPNAPSENPPSESELARITPGSTGAESKNRPNGNASLRCYVHCEKAVWWQRLDSGWVCGLCHPNPADFGAG